ncbi:MAG: lysine exporter LysO family protein [Marinifilaceae bacterium]
MKGSVIIVACFLAGVAMSRFGLIPAVLLETDFTLYALFGLMFLVGISIGSDSKALEALRKPSLGTVLVPLGTIVGTLAGCAAVSVFLPSRSVADCMAIGSGFGYYSLSSVFITEYKGAEWGTVALTANILREIFALLLAPALALYFGKLAPISAGGATTMDTTLPIITRVSGVEYAGTSIFHGFVVDFSVPFLVTLFCTI